MCAATTGLDMRNKPTTDALFDFLTQGSRVPLDEVKRELDRIRHPLRIAVRRSKNAFNVGAIIRTGLDRLKEQGVTRVLAVPGMLFAAGHAKNDIPSVLNTYAAQHGTAISYGRELGVDRSPWTLRGWRL